MHTKFEENEIIPGAEPCHRVGHKFTEEVETKIKSNSPYFYMENDSITDENNIKKTIERRQKLENDEDKNPLHRNKIEDIINRININSIR